MPPLGPTILCLLLTVRLSAETSIALLQTHCERLSPQCSNDEREKGYRNPGFSRGADANY